MTINERIRFLRKNILHLNQRQFASDLGMAQTGISGMEQDGATITERVIKAICLAYNVNNDWIRHGNEPIFVQQKNFSLDEFIKNNGASDLELAILKAYFELDPDIRKAVIQHFKDKLENKETAPLPDIPDTPEEFEAAYPPLEEDGADVG